MTGGCLVAALLAGAIAGCAGAAPVIPRAPTPLKSSPIETADPPPPPPPHAVPPPPTWSAIYAAYFGEGSAGSCGRSRSCHADEMRDAGAAYDWLARRGYIDGTQSALVRANSCLRWFGGNMPPQGQASSDDARRELEAWVAAGAPDD